ncbi:hypothetical protein L195_g050547 [Trifolium pratense]|uniref:Uncharacterized protein n=1 Tax=Trifolium pratense TaxID=57577 RepID=A0A2K3JUH9_TRIPR|nr:hypothetical protein L195_g050547 [Trifolium pratense]
MERFIFSQSNIGSSILNSLTQNHDSCILHVDASLACNCNGFSHVVESRWLVFGELSSIAARWMFLDETEAATLSGSPGSGIIVGIETGRTQWVAWRNHRLRQTRFRRDTPFSC